MPDATASSTDEERVQTLPSNPAPLETELDTSPARSPQTMMCSASFIEADEVVPLLPENEVPLPLSLRRAGRTPPVPETFRPLADKGQPSDGRQETAAPTAVVPTEAILQSCDVSGRRAEAGDRSFETPLGRCRSVQKPHQNSPRPSQEVVF